MRGARARLAVAALVGAALAGCGGGERQDAGAPAGDFRVDVTRASFPARQSVAESATLRLRIANRGDRAVPDLALTVETEPGERGQAPASFGQPTADATLADRTQPVWIVDRGPAGGASAYTNTWAVGPLGGGEVRTVEWRVTAVKPGRYTVGWRLAPALEGDARFTGTGRTEGRFRVTIDDAPVPARVGAGGEVVRGEEPGR